MEIKREDHPWGVRLIIRPFAQKHAHMEISAEISQPREKHGPEIKVWFTGVPSQNMLPYTDAVIWSRALATIQSESLKIRDELKSKPAAKKSAKKK